MLKRSLTVAAAMALTGCVVAPGYPGYGAYDPGYGGAPVYETAPGYGYAPAYGGVELSVGGYRDGYDRRRADPPRDDQRARADAQQRGGGRQDFRDSARGGPGAQPAPGGMRQGRPERQANEGRGHDGSRDDQRGFGH